jgi:hypothetical protein
VALPGVGPEGVEALIPAGSLERHGRGDRAQGAARGQGQDPRGGAVVGASDDASGGRSRRCRGAVCCFFPRRTETVPGQKTSQGRLSEPRGA